MQLNQAFRHIEFPKSVHYPKISTSNDLMYIATNFRIIKVLKTSENVLKDLSIQIEKLEEILFNLYDKSINRGIKNDYAQSRFYRECVEAFISSVTHYDLSTVSIQLEMFINEMGYSSETMNADLQVLFYTDYLCEILKSIRSGIEQAKDIKLPEAIYSFARAHANQHSVYES